MRSKLSLFFILVLIILGKFAYDQVKSPFDKGAAVPDFALSDLQGDTVRLSELKGVPVLVHFWATWCGSCRAEMGGLEKFVKDVPGIKVLAVSEDEAGVEAVKNFFGAKVPGYSVLMDSGGRVADLYKSYKIPETYFIDKDGLFLKKVSGPISWDDNKAQKYVLETFENPN